MKKLLMMVLVLMMMSTYAFAANFGLISVSANIADASSIMVGGQTGATKGPEISFSGVDMSTTWKMADWYTDLQYSSNLASVKLTMTNVSTDNAGTTAKFPVDGLVNWATVVPGMVEAAVTELPLQFYVQAPATATPTVGTTGALTLYDSQYFKSYTATGILNPILTLATGMTADSHVVIPATGPVNNVSKKVFYKANFTNATPGGYGAIVQYGFKVE